MEVLDQPQVGFTPTQEKPEPSESTTAEVKRWLSRIESSKKKFKDDFQRMRDNMKFVYGKQWDGQAELDTDCYVANQTLRMVNQKVATLYAKNPTAEVEVRKRLNYQIWDGNVDTLMEMAQRAMMIQQTGMPLPPELAAFFADVQMGRQREALVKKVAKTLEIAYQYFVDAQKPDFIAQAKQMVRRAVICGVAYIRPVLCTDSEGYAKVSSIEYPDKTKDLVNRAKEIITRMEDGEVDATSADVETFQSLTKSLGLKSQTDAEDNPLPVRLEFDFPPATSIIVDERCRNLEEFIAARWVAQEYRLPVTEVNELFGVDVKVGAGGATEFKATDWSKDQVNDPQAKKMVSLYEVWDKSTLTRFFVVEGWNEFVVEPEPINPMVSGFWQHFALVLNACEYEEDSGASIYPPSDVQQIKHPQKEWNRTRDALRAQRNANAPKYLVRKGVISEEDKERLRCAKPNQVIELDSVPLDQPLEKFVVVMQVAQIDPKVYDTAPLEQDMFNAGGMQQANIGPAQPNVTATVGTIAEQSRLTVSASNVDDLDGCLTRVAQASGEMLLRAAPKEVMVRVSGVGAVWPELEQSREDFLNEVFLKIKAASSGRPNKAVEIANYQGLAPIMLQAGANPVGVIKEGARRLDDNLDVMEFFPILPTGGASASGEQQPQPSASGQGQVQPSGLRRPPQNGSEVLGNPQDNTVELPKRRIAAPSAANMAAA